MKKITFATILALLYSLAFAQTPAPKWFPYSSSMFLVSSMENDKILLSAGIDGRDNALVYRIFDITETYCKPGVTGDLEKFPPYKINDKYVRVLSWCINGIRLIAPETPEGRKYFNNQIDSGNVVTVETNMGASLHFKGGLPSDLRAKIFAAKNAM